ncbi:MBL fold metallo-hydrolase [Microbulbifer spongiae]|uniref:MBL fold metallo-hydrolase n=1 Tax=Microbulbifer spongiae TaxID=2944933 RepID=A0ABY9EAJ4_9GAMM|nr:MBL fold metallo-hydrolase [Microbulbifer sp. MI-G]WKD49177.1 MBL fold metallo-hydrolase [Microbulbifer sp. MI-G]
MKNYNYLLMDNGSREAMIVDPAWEINKVHLALETQNAQLKGILITHSHLDHINLAGQVAEEYQCPIFMSGTEIIFSGFSSPYLQAIEETSLSLGKLVVEAIATPGHTPGCICYRTDNFLFTGDVLFAEGCGMCPNPDAARQMFWSLQKLRNRLNSSTRIFPGHSFGLMPGQTFAMVQQQNLYLQIPSEESFIDFRMRKQCRKKLFAFH